MQPSVCCVGSSALSASAMGAPPAAPAARASESSAAFSVADSVWCSAGEPALSAWMDATWRR